MGLCRAGSDEGRSPGAGARGDREHPEGRPRLSLDSNIDETFALIAAVPAQAVVAIFGRYGRPLAVPMPPDADDDRRALLALPEGDAARVRVLQVRTSVDVIANDYFVLERPGEDALAVAGPLFAGALAALARAAGVPSP